MIYAPSIHAPSTHVHSTRRVQRLLRLAFLCLLVLLATGCATTTTSTDVGEDGGSGRLEACASNDDCGADAYCRFALGRCGGTGSCEPRPEVCTFEFDPVCGCDQNTYSNACGAASEGWSVLRKGRCGSDG